MKTKFNSIRKIVLATALLSAISLFNGCKKFDAPPPVGETAVQIRPGIFQVNFDGLRSDGGFAYKIGYVLPGGDSNEFPTVSVLRIFENGVELHPAHSQHADIRDFGKGRFSHWGTTLYFSTSDNTDPVTNGREYTYTTDGGGYR